MSQALDDLTPRPAPCPSENKTDVIVPSVPDVSMVFDSVNTNNIRPQSFMTNMNLTRPMFNRPPSTFEPIIEHDQYPRVKSPPPVVFGHKVEYQQQYLTHQHQLLQKSEIKKQQYVQQNYTPPPQQHQYTPPPQQHQCVCHSIKLSPMPHIVSGQSHNEIESPVSVSQSAATQESSELKQILEILKHNQSELQHINEINERNQKQNEKLLCDLQESKTTVTSILNKQNTIETKINEMELKMDQHFNEIKTLINTKLNNFMNNNNIELGNLQILPKHTNSGKLIFNNRPGDDNNQLILNDCKNSPIFGPQKPKSNGRISPVSNISGQVNGDMKELFNKYEIKGALNRRSIDYSMSSLNYLQRYGLLEEHK